MEPIGLCGGGLVACLLFLVAVVGSAALAGGIALALAKLGVTVDRRLQPKTAGEPDRAADETAATTPRNDKPEASG